ncbi:hypothetical protein K488DRAFT_88087 [Vararia minispora EC-137]|uniref:Uncharacterized protein n=1 Tax=Vararia minispora EC-137 TaxID=1314806 RepID=A0ACB8QEQ0_9AGAM|nr:hypothetical protein K488DRAFT_88087 [Vararia minispora EC-137]
MRIRVPDIPSGALGMRDTPHLPSSEPPSPPMPTVLDFLPHIPSSSASPLDPFDFANIGNQNDHAWTSDDLPAGQDEGEYTGKFTFLTVPTKQDPPTTRTRDRIQNWGRPVSPYPFPRPRSPLADLPHFEDEPEDMDIDHEVHTSVSLRRAGEDAMRRERTPTPTRRDPTPTPTRPEPTPPPDDRRPSSPVRQPVFTKPPSKPLSTIQKIARRTPNPRHKTPPARQTPSPPRADPTSLPAPSSVPPDDLPPSPPATSPHASGSALPPLDTHRTHPSPHTPPPSAPPAALPVRQDEADDARDGRVDGQAELGHRDTDDGGPVGGVHDEIDAQDEEASDSSDAGEADESVIKIVSDNPWQAARAAAILKQHNYDFVTEIKRKPPLDLDKLFRKSNRSRLSSAGITKARRPPPPLRTPSPSPSPSPASSSHSDTRVLIDTRGPRAWAREDWKLLDACLTDERLSLAERQGDTPGSLADADTISLADVVARFLDFIGGDDVLRALGPTWTREDIGRRARALLKKHRAGDFAPPTPRGSVVPSTPRGSVVPSTPRGTTPVVPDFTPVGRGRQTPALESAKLPARERAPRWPGALGAPRYAHLLEEARSVARVREEEDEEEEGDQMEVEQSIASDADERTDSSRAPSYLEDPPPPPSLGARVKGFIFSYLPTRSNAPKHKPAADGLPLPPPPPARARAPVVTPVSKLPPAHAHPRELVELQHAPTPVPRAAPRVAHPRELVELEHVPTPAPAPSRLPRRLDPKRLVELRHVEVPVLVRAEVRERRSSGSVRELVRAFEEGRPAWRP